MATAAIAQRSLQPAARLWLGYGVFAALLARSSASVILNRYLDPKCTILESGEGVQQSWVWQNTGLDSSCYDVNVGLGCDFRCNMKLVCEYKTGSGVVLKTYDDSNCLNNVLNSEPMAEHMTWLEALALFEGNCSKTEDGFWMKFNTALPKFPDCSAFGAVESGASGTAAAFETTYDLKWYSDNSCLEEYQVTGFSSFAYNSFKFWVHRGAQHCLDYTDETVRDLSNFSANVISLDIKNFKLVCGNNDALGNGVMIRPYLGEACSGISGDARYWREAFYPMNSIALKEFFNAECTTWGNLWVKMDRPFDPRHFPDCSSFACKSGYCSGGRIQREHTGASKYVGDIRTVVTQAQDGANLARRQAVEFALSVAILAATSQLVFVN